ncbi:MAG TPA: methionyl-tRNA formyltransferase [Actinomycetota bacterium]|jgi:methionyl-tRNA formyltransferase
MSGLIRVVFLGNDAWSVRPLAALADAGPAIDLALAVTRDPRPGRRGAPPVPTPVAALARERAIRLLETPTVRSGPGFDGLLAADPDVIAVVAYGELLPAEVLGAAAIGAVNLHFSLLPRWRGAAPIQRAILAGDRTTGVTTMLMEEGLDAGPILEQREEPIRAEDDAGSLGERLSATGAGLLVGSIVGFADGSITPRPQTGVPTSAPKITPDDRPIDWSDSADAIVRRIRALSPSPGATTIVRGAPVKVLRAEAFAGRGEPGIIAAVDGEAIEVGARDGSVRLLEVAPAGRRRMSGGDLARGSRLGPGERLG